MIGRLRDWAKAVKTDLVAVYLAGRDPRTPPLAKVVAIITVAYALSPIDLIPDFIPVLGYLDDLIVVPLGLMIVIRMIPADLLREFLDRAGTMGRLPANRIAAAAILAVWVLITLSGIAWVWSRRRFSG